MNEPQQYFRGVNAPAELFDLVEDGVITDAQAWLALTIDSFVNSRGEGCWAGNGKLAKKTHKKIRYVQKNLTKLLELGLVFRVGSKIVNGKKMRILETKWSRVYINTDVVQNMGVNGKTGVLQDTCPTGHPRSNGSVSKIELDECVDRSQTRDPTHLNSLTNPHESPSPLPHLGVSLDLELVNFLRQVASEVKQIRLNGSKKPWLEKMGILRRELGNDKRLKKVLGGKWYKDHAGKGKVPVITCAKSIRMDIFIWVEEKMQEDQGATNGEREVIGSKLVKGEDGLMYKQPRYKGEDE